METSREDLLRHNASLSDAELLAIDRNELTDLGRQCYHPEVKRRDLSKESDAQQKTDAHDEVPDWLGTATIACSFQVGTGQ